MSDKPKPNYHLDPSVTVNKDAVCANCLFADGDDVEMDDKGEIIGIYCKLNPEEIHIHDLASIHWCSHHPHRFLNAPPSPEPDEDGPDTHHMGGK